MTGYYGKELLKVLLLVPSHFIFLRKAFMEKEMSIICFTFFKILFFLEIFYGLYKTQIFHDLQCYIST